MPPPPPAPNPDPALAREAVEVRIAALRAEVEATTDRARQAVLLYEIGHLCEHRLGNDAMAVKEYLGAYNLDASFRPPLFDLVRIFERRLSFKNLARLYETEQRAAGTAGEAASALVDRGVLLEDHLDRAADARRSYEQALEADASSRAAALMLEHTVRAQGDADAVERVVAVRARQARDPILKGTLLVEAAHHKERRGDVDGAMADLQLATEQEAGRWRFLGDLERVARRQGRLPELLQALEGKATLAEATARAEDAGQGSGAFAIQRFPEAEQAASRAAALWYEAARLRLAHLGDAEGATAALDQALALRPDDVLLRQEHMLACELAGHLDKVGEDAAALIAAGATGPFAAAQHFRQAELAQSREDPAAAREALNAALQADPGSPAAMAVLDDLLLDDDLHDERLEQLEARAERTSGAARVGALWRAAQIAVEQLGDFERGRDLYRRAADEADDPVPILRELFGAARRRQARAALWEAALLLLDADLAAEERSALLHDLVTLGEDGPDERSTRGALLDRALADPVSARWAADAARLHGAWHHDEGLLARAHIALAGFAAADEAAAAHLCAAARAVARGGDEGQAIALLRQALERVPGHRYAVALLEELLRASGQADAVVELLREAASAQQGSEMTLLLAGAAAEAAGDMKLAAQTYQEAADYDPTSVAPLWSLRRLAERTGDRALLGQALEGLSEREIAAGDPGRATLELGEHHLLVTGTPERAEQPLRAALDDPEVAAAAALDLLFMPLSSLEPEARVDAAHRLFELAPEADRPWAQRELAHALRLADGGGSRVLEVAHRMLEANPQEPFALWTRLRSLGADGAPSPERADAWIALGEATSDRHAGVELLLHGLRAKTIAQGEDAADDAFLLAHALNEEQPDAPAAAVALDETLGGADDPDARAQTLAARLDHAGPEGRAALEAAHGRALLAAGRAGEALPVLRAVVAQDEGDLAAWEALRVAAREERAWREVARACDRLAAAVNGPLRAQLLEEAAAVLMDDLGDDAGAEQRLRAALEVDATRPIAYGRLHDLLAEREDTPALLDLVTRRIGAIEEPSDLEKLYYEQARLRRSEADREGALESLHNLLTLDEQHVGGLALAVEVHVSLEQWVEAVDTLRRLAASDVPPKQKRLTHLGAADFLDRRLGDSEGAMAELRKVEELGLADATVYARMADVAERTGRVDEAVAALDRAVELGRGAERAELARRAGDLRTARTGDRAGAVQAYRIALSEAPTHLPAGEALVSLLDDAGERRAVADAFERAVRTQILDRDPTDEDGLRMLARAAAWKGDRDLQFVALSALVALGIATDDERQADQDRTEITERTLPRGALTDQALERLRAPGDAGPLQQLARLASEGLLDMDGTDPAVHGVHRSHAVDPKAPYPLRDEVFLLAQVFNLPPGDFYAGGAPDLIAVLPGRRDRPTWITGPRVRAPMDPRDRFEVGRLAMAFAEGTLPLMGRPPGQAINRLLAATAASGVDLSAAARRPGVQELAPDLSRALPRRSRKAIAELGSTLEDDVQAFQRYVQAARRSTLHAGLLVSGDLGMALWAVLGEPADLTSVRASEDARDLVRFWISTDALALRRALGMAA
jgi:cellulose synthase operon protein C